MPSNKKTYTIERVNFLPGQDRRTYKSTSEATVTLAHLTPLEVVDIITKMMISGEYGDFVVSEIKN